MSKSRLSSTSSTIRMVFNASGPVAYGQGERERRTFAERAFHLDVTLHQTSETTRDCEAETGAPVDARASRVGLLEFLENRIEFVGGYADSGIGHSDFHGAVASRGTHCDTARQRGIGRGA